MLLSRNIPLSLSTTKDGKTTVDTTALLRKREDTFALDTSQPFKLNAGTTGVCERRDCFSSPMDTHVVLSVRVLYTPDRLSKIAAEAAKDSSVFTLDDRMGLLQDAFALAMAGFSKLSSALTVVEHWRSEAKCKYLPTRQNSHFD